MSYNKIKPYICVLPAILLVGILMFGSIISAFCDSLGFGVYKELFCNENFLDSFFLSFKISTISTCISGVFSILIIYFIYNVNFDFKFKNVRLIKKIFNFPMIMPYVVVAYMIFLILSPSGVLSRILFSTGIITSSDEFFILTNDKNSIGIIASYVYKTTPFIVIMMYSGLFKMQSEFYELSRVLGISKLVFFKNVVFSYIKGTYIVSLCMIYTYMLGDFEIPYMLGVVKPKTLAVLSYQMHSNYNVEDKAIALAINIIIIASIFLVFGLYYLLIKLNQRRKLKMYE